VDGEALVGGSVEELDLVGGVHPYGVADQSLAALDLY